MGPAHRSRFRSRAAVIVTLAALPILWTPNVVVARKVVGRGRRSIIEKGGWATMAGTDAPSSAVVTGQATCCGSHPATSASTILVCCSARIARRSSGRPVAPVGCPSGSAGRGPRDRTGRYHPAEIETGIRRQKNYPPEKNSDPQAAAERGARRRAAACPLRIRETTRCVDPAETRPTSPRGQISRAPRQNRRGRRRAARGGRSPRSDRRRSPR